MWVVFLGKETGRCAYRELFMWGNLCCFFYNIVLYGQVVRECLKCLIDALTSVLCGQPPRLDETFGPTPARLLHAITQHLGAGWDFCRLRLTHSC